VLTTASSATRAVWLPRAVAEGAGMVRVDVSWAQVAPVQRAPGFNAADPSSTGYDWASVDDQVRDLSSHGLKILMTIDTAPSWAEGAHKPGSAQPGTWRPSAREFGAFAKAAATRYDGRFADPLVPGGHLPRVKYWQGWNEPNLAYYLSPSWIRVGRHWVAESPTLFRALTNSFYVAVKRASRSNFVVLGGTAPYGDPPGGQRIPPAQFDRDLFCLDNRLHPTRCTDPVHMDALDHHPYGIGGPLWSARNPDDVAVPDLGKLTRILQAAKRWHRVLPGHQTHVWVTEISWDSDPPDPHGVPIEQQARWYEQSMYVLWRQGVDTVLFLQLADSPPIPSYAASYQAGLYFMDGTPKPSAIAFRFPFVTRRVDKGHIQPWGWAPQSGQLMIEQQRHGIWKVLKRLAVRRRQIFLSSLPIRGRTTLRAQIGSQTSLSWTQS